MPRRYELLAARDGIQLATDVYLPVGRGPFPAILQRTPYGKLADRPVAYAEWCAAHGYAGVVQDVRGRHDSEGAWTPYDNHEETDGYDTIAWITRQPWSDGRVAGVGSSYGAFAAFMAGLSGHPALRAIVARVPATGLYHRHFYYGGIFSLARLAWGTSVNRRIVQATWSEEGPPRDLFLSLIAEHPEVLLHLPVAEIGDVFPMRLPWWRTWLQHPGEDEYWRRLEVVHRFGQLRLPVYHVGGWHDDFVTAPLENFTRARRAHPDAPVGAQRLLMGMWPHALNERREHGGLDYGPEAVIPLWERELQWLDRWVRGQPEAVDEPPVRLFLMGPNTWRAYRAWPPETTRPRELFLRAGGRLSFEEPGPEPPDTYRYDPLHPTAQPWDFGEPDLPVLPPWPLHPDPGPDRVLYRSEPLPRPLTVIGEVWLRLHAASSAPDTDWFAWVAWEEPGTGRARLLTYGYAVRARYRRGFARAEPLEPGAVERYELNLGATARVLPAGARLLCCIQSSCVPWFSRNLNTGGDNHHDRISRPAEQRVYHDREHPSALVLPVEEGGG